MRVIRAILLIFLTFSCKAQGLPPNLRINPLYNSSFELSSSDYVKDIDNNLNPYEGTWLWQEGNNSLTIQFQKIEMFLNDNVESFTYYMDCLIGEYKYVENGNVLFDFLPVNFSGDQIDENNMVGSILFNNSTMVSVCPECSDDARFVLGYFTQDDRPDLVGRLRMGIFNDNGIDKLRIRLGFLALLPSTPNNYFLSKS